MEQDTIVAAGEVAGVLSSINLRISGSGYRLPSPALLSYRLQ